jgi:hypothetical protein
MELQDIVAKYRTESWLTWYCKVTEVARWQGRGPLNSSRPARAVAAGDKLVMARVPNSSWPTNYFSGSET